MCKPKPVTEPMTGKKLRGLLMTKLASVDPVCRIALELAAHQLDAQAAELDALKAPVDDEAVENIISGLTLCLGPEAWKTVADQLRAAFRANYEEREGLKLCLGTANACLKSEAERVVKLEARAVLRRALVRRARNVLEFRMMGGEVTEECPHLKAGNLCPIDDERCDREGAGSSFCCEHRDEATIAAGEASAEREHEAAAQADEDGDDER